MYDVNKQKLLVAGLTTLALGAGSYFALSGTSAPTPERQREGVWERPRRAQSPPTNKPRPRRATHPQKTVAPPRKIRGTYLRLQLQSQIIGVVGLLPLQ